MSSALLLAAVLVEPGALHWSAPEGCPSHEDVVALLEREDVPEERRVEAETSAVVTATDRGTWLVRIAIEQPSGELRRELELDSCAATAEAVALVYALALTKEEEAEPPPIVPERASDEAPAERVPPPLEPDPPLPVASRTSPPPRSSAPPRLAVYAGAGGGAGTIGPGGGHVLAGIGAVWRWVRLGVRIDHAIVRPFRVDGGIGANVSATTGGLELGIPIPVGPVELVPGVDVRAGGVRARAIGGVSPDTRWVEWAIVGAGLSLAWMPGRWWGFRVAAAVEVPLVRHTFVFDVLEVARTQRVGGLFWLGPEFRLPRGSTGPSAHRR